MRPTATLFNLLLAALLAAPAVQPVHADEGLWTFDNFPAARVRQLYGVDITPAWLDKVRTATARLANCTASFVSPDGLILTNQHCAASCLSQWSTTARNLINEGFAASARDDEPRCATQRADVLVAMEEITAQVNAATSGLADQAANDARRRQLTTLEQQCEQAVLPAGSLKCESVKLYQGGQYFLYKYKRFTDVRLVFAPEDAIANFGGDPDNYQFPRWNLDFALMRAYENGKPASTPDYRRINWDGPAAGEVVFVPGHPGTTDRLLTVAQLQRTARSIHHWLLRSSELRGRLIQFSRESPARASIAADMLLDIENLVKRRRKQLDALLDDRLMARKQAEEAELRARAGKLPGRDPWEQIALAARREQELADPYEFIEQRAGFDSKLYDYAITLVRAAAERSKPNAGRLREFTEAALPRVQQRLEAPVPIHPELEQLTLSFGLERMREYLGPDYPLVRNLMRELSPDELARGLVTGTRLADPAVRKALWDGGQAAIDASQDPMIRIALLVDPQARAIRRQYEDEYEAPTEAASEKIATARFSAYGTSVYPDATFTLRLNYGTVQGWVEDDKPVNPFTHLDLLYARATGADPFRVPEIWLQAQDRLDMSTPFNLATNNDIVGGNSGSALLNARGEIVGLMFDNNIHGIAGSYWVDPLLNRAVAVHPAIIRLALTQVYALPSVAKELGL
jgi:hypothetical protein